MAFESILSVHGDEVSMLNDMIVVVEDLRNVEFNLILVDKKSKFKLKKGQNFSPLINYILMHFFFITLVLKHLTPEPNPTYLIFLT